MQVPSPENHPSYFCEKDYTDNINWMGSNNVTVFIRNWQTRGNNGHRGKVGRKLLFKDVFKKEWGGHTFPSFNWLFQVIGFYYVDLSLKWPQGCNRTLLLPLLGPPSSGWLQRLQSRFLILLLCQEMYKPFHQLGNKPLFLI